MVYEKANQSLVYVGSLSPNPKATQEAVKESCTQVKESVENTLLGEGIGEVGDSLNLAPSSSGHSFKYIRFAISESHLHTTKMLQEKCNHMQGPNAAEVLSLENDMY